MDKLRIFFGLRQNPPQNDFRNPIWSSDDEDDGDELYTRHEMEDFNDALDMHEEFSRQMFDILRSFGSMFGDVKSFINDAGPFDSLSTIHTLPPEHGDQEHFNGDNIRDYYLKPGYKRPQEPHLKEDKDLDGKITPNDISGLFKKKKDTPPLTPFNGALVPGGSFCQTIITTSVTKSDGSVETRRIVKNGNEVIEETVSSTSTGTDTRMPPHTPGLDQLSSPGYIYRHVLSELSSLFRNFY